MQQKMKTSSIGKLIFSIVLSIACTITLMFTSQSNLHDKNTVCLWILACIYLFLFWEFLFWGYDMKKFMLLKRAGRKAVLIFATIILAVVGFFAFPFQYDKVVVENNCRKILLGEQTIQIKTLGEKNEKSEGYDVWLEGIRVDGKDYNLYEIALNKDWDYEEDRPFTDKKDAKAISISLDVKKDYDVMFRRGPQAGKIEVTVGETSKEIDLYAEKEEQRYKLDLEGIIAENLHIQEKATEEAGYSIAYIVLLLGGSFTLVMWIYAALAKEKHIKQKEME